MTQVNDQLTRLAESSKKEKITPPNYDEIILTQEEISEALRIAREVKYYELKRQEYIINLKKERVFKLYTAKELFDLISQTITQSGELYIVDDENMDQIKQMCLYFSGDTRFNGDLG